MSSLDDDPGPAVPPEPQAVGAVYTVTRLNREIRQLLEGSIPPLWVEGEISNLARPASGHLYFTLKDDLAQVRCVLFRSQQRALTAVPRDGLHVLIRASVGLYEGRGEYQLLVSRLEEAGEGALRRKFEVLRQKLLAEGLFDSARKKPLPRLPRKIGVITSPSGAALRDVLTTLGRRFPAISVQVIPVPVQGEDAAAKIAAALRLAARRGDCDALIVARGGGSLEDLWAFNEEIVVRAIADSPIPVVSGVGHETDITLSDLAADARAPTPTAAAEMLSPDQTQWLAAYAQRELQLVRLVRARLSAAFQHLDHLAARLTHPRERLAHLRERLDRLTLRLRYQESSCRAAHRARLFGIAARLERQTPALRLRETVLRVENERTRLLGALRRGIAVRHDRLSGVTHVLDTLSPLATLGRGYAIVTGPRGTIVRDAADLGPGDRIDARLSRGRVVARIESSGSDA